MLWFVIALALRRRFQFSLRSLLALVLAVAIPCSWFATERRSANRQAEAVRAIEAVGADVTYDHEYDSNNPSEYRAPPECLRKLLGTDFFANVLAVESRCDPSGNWWWWPTDADLAHLESLGRLRRLRFSGGAHITDAGLQHIRKLSSLRELSLDGTGITGAGLVYLEGLGGLTSLNLSKTVVGDRDLEHLRGMKKLVFLDLSTHVPHPLAEVNLDTLTTFWHPWRPGKSLVRFRPRRSHAWTRAHVLTRRLLVRCR